MEDHDSACNKKPRSAEDLDSAYDKFCLAKDLASARCKERRLAEDHDSEKMREKKLKQRWFQRKRDLQRKKTYESEGFRIRSKQRIYLTQYCEEALTTFNSKNSSNYGFVDLVNYTVHSSCGLLYYITFKAKDPSDQTCLIFETEVWMKIMNQGFQVQFCRIKSTQ